MHYLKLRLIIKKKNQGNSQWTIQHNDFDYNIDSKGKRNGNHFEGCKEKASNNVWNLLKSIWNENMNEWQSVIFCDESKINLLCSDAWQIWVKRSDKSKLKFGNVCKKPFEWAVLWFFWWFSAKSPDLNPIEKVWNELKVAVGHWSRKFLCNLKELSRKNGTE